MKDLNKYGIQLLQEWGYTHTRKSQVRGNNEVFTHTDSATEYTVLFHSRRIPASESPDEVFKYERIDRVTEGAEAEVIYCYVCYHEIDKRIRALTFKLRDAEQMPTYNDAPIEGFNVSVLNMKSSMSNAYAFKEFKDTDRKTTAPEHALFINGVFESVLDEIVTAQAKQPDLSCYLQPYKDMAIRMLQKQLPSPEAPVRLYFSTTAQLDQICFTADLVGWEDKRTMSPERKEALLPHYTKFQPEELEYFTNDTKAVNFLTIRNLKKCKSHIPVRTLHKISDGKPYGPRTQAGGWSEVEIIPDFTDLETKIKDRYDAEFDQELEVTSKLTDAELTEALSTDVNQPERVQVISIAFKRKASVVVATLRRANGICERCNQPAPFIRKSDSSPYLEVHHWTPLSDGGRDHLDNTAALCPNCHREVHHD